MLELGLSTRAGRVAISCDPSHSSELQRLRARFVTGTTISAIAFEIDLDDLLVNLTELTMWPAGDVDVRWAPELLAMAESNAIDAQTLQGGLEIKGDGTTAEAGQVPRLASSFTAPLTGFQHRDIERLLHLAHGANFSVPGAGKTRVALSVFVTRREADEIRQMLVVCPKSAFESWVEEISICFPTGGVHVAIMSANSVPAADVVLVNYERLP